MGGLAAGGQILPRAEAQNPATDRLFDAVSGVAKG
jgi:hypothetical protein